MAEEGKRGFVLYFDAYPNIQHLPPRQKGELLDALFQYAAASAAGPAPQSAVLDQHPDMSPETRMAFHFMGEAIRRDTEKWRQKHLRYQAAARRRCGGEGEADAWLLRQIRDRENG